jgi:predicted GIY-YIG superfamily endonuclease
VSRPETDPGTVYLLHLDPPYRHARHYVGWTRDLAARLDAHRAGQGARLMEVVKQAGGTFRLARTWPGGRDRERAIKNRHEAPKLCPECSPHPRPVERGRSADAPKLAVPPPRTAPEPARIDPHTRGIAMARQFLAVQLAAGRTADQIAATHDYITGPWRAAGHHTPAQAETYRGYADHIGQQLMQLRSAGATTPAPEPGRLFDPQQSQMEAGS